MFLSVPTLLLFAVEKPSFVKESAYPEARRCLLQGRSTEPSLVTPAQRSEAPRSRTPQRPPPVDTTSPGLVFTPSGLIYP